MTVVALKSRRVKQNSREWFDCELAEKKVVAINYLKNRKNEFHTDKEIYKTA